jgi:hypothetical protein
MAEFAVWSQIAASIAVLLTLVYLTIQVRQNAALIRAETRQAMMSHVQQEIFKAVDHPEITLDLHDSTELTPKAKVRLNNWLNAALRAREHEWLQYRDGVVDRDSWEAYRQVIPTIILGTERTRRWWAKFGRGQFHPEFCKLVDGLIADAPASDWIQNILEFE